MIESLQAPFVYVDANLFIYAIEGDDALAGPLKEFLKERPGLAATSELTLAEVLPKAQPPLRRSYFNLIVWSKVFDLRPVTRGILVETADYRRIAATPLPDGRTAMPKLPDAIHVVTAIRSGCKRVLSADARLRLPEGMVVVEPSKGGLSGLVKEIT